MGPAGPWEAASVCGATPACGCLSLVPPHPALAAVSSWDRPWSSESVTPGPGMEEAATSIWAWVCAPEIAVGPRAPPCDPASPGGPVWPPVQFA